MGKPRTASATGGGGSGSDDLLHQIKEAMKDDNVVAHLAERIAAIVTDKITARLDRLEKTVTNKETKIKQLEQNVTHLEAQVDNLEQYSRRTSIRITGMEENKNGDLEKITTNLIGDMNLQDHITLDNINRLHGIGPRNSLTNKNHARQIIIQFKDYKSKTTFIKGRKSLRSKYPDVYITEDLTKTRSRLLYVARSLKRLHKIQDCWSYDGRIMIKDLQGKIGNINSEDELNNF